MSWNNKEETVYSSLQNVFV